MQSAEETVMAFVSCWGKNRHELIYGCYEKYFTEKTLWENVGISTTVGIAPAQKFIEGFIQKTNAYTVDIDVVHLMSKGDQVILERLEHFKDEAGEEFMTLRVTGSFTIKDGKIVHWRDYLDSAYYEKWLASRK